MTTQSVQEPKSQAVRKQPVVVSENSYLTRPRLATRTECDIVSKRASAAGRQQ